MYGGDGAGGTIASLAALLQEAVQFVLEVRVSQLGLLQVDVCEAEGGGGPQAGGGSKGATAGRQRPQTAARRTGQGAGRQAAEDGETEDWSNSCTGNSCELKSRIICS